VEPERDFVQWLDRRDADALGRVFDATGGKLLLLAAHLTRSGAHAQDLVQATFLAAMARGASWDRQRPLWPWLAAILHNELRMQMRDGRRRREVDLDLAADEPDLAADPSSVASSQEVLAKVLAAIDAMPLPYRQVLRLRLVHGLRPVEIARSLEVPVGTVRAQLHRGLEQLRGALPAGVAGMLAALFVGDAALLAQVRERVLAHAASGAASATAGVGTTMVLGGWLSMHGKMIVGIGAGVALLLVLGLMVGFPEWLAGRPLPPEPALPVHAELPRAVTDLPATTLPDRRTAVAAEDAVWPLIVTVQTHDGTPVPGADVTVWTTLQGSVYWNRDASEFGREDIAAGATGTDGVFRASLDHLRERSLLANRTTWLGIEATWPHDVPQYRIVELPRTRGPAQVTATIEMHRRGVVITGQAVDGAGLAIARAQVGTARSKYLSVGNDAQTRADGTFFVSWDGDAESWPDQLVIASPAYGTATVVLPAWSAEQHVVDLGPVVLQAVEIVHGRAVLGDGSALAGIQLQVEAIDPSLGNDLRAIHRWLMSERRQHTSLGRHDRHVVWDGAQTHTLADGSFRFAGLKPDGVYLLSVWAIGAPADTVVRPGGDPIELRIDKQLLAIDVFDERGAAVPGAQVRLPAYEPGVTRARCAATGCPARIPTGGGSSSRRSASSFA
jgi:RNA polymerase sigma-70 factor (ECF subfamily)